MKSLFTLLALLLIGLRLSAQTAAPVRLAIISESADALAAADVLTAELTGHKNLHLLERNEIDRVYREQGLSAGNRDYLKLGQILGADGLLLFEIVKTRSATNLMARLIAVKPGVVLVAEKYSWLIENLTGWSPPFARHLDLFLPKLAVLVKDAIPISVVNLRSAVSSVEALEAEQQLKLLAIQRLSRERSLFVLERQRMQLMTREKDYKLDDSAFWNGSYLLEGVVDQNGYSLATVTINARLTPPKGGAPFQFEVKGSRTNLANVINQLVAKVNEALKIDSTMKEWNAAEEAAQYFAEAKWAFDWGVLAEAQAAVESAWALGKKDPECAVLRITTYMDQLPEVLPLDIDSKSTDRRGYRFVRLKDYPDRENCDLALAALLHYEESCRDLLSGRQRTSLQTNQFEPEWYRLGIKVLNASSGVLWHFHQYPELQEPVREKLSDVRLGARRVAKLIANLPMNHGGNYDGKCFPSARLFSYLEDFKNELGIFECTVKWGCFWQDRPEAAVALYRELMAMPPFQNGMMGIWADSPGFPRLAVWSREDRNQASTIWQAFMNELSTSTNYLYRVQAKGLACAFAGTEAWQENQRNRRNMDGNLEFQANKNWQASCNALVDYISRNYAAIVAGNGILAQHDWGMRSLLPYPSESEKAFSAAQRTYLEKSRTRLAQKEVESTYSRQVNHLKENKPYEFFEFARLFNGLTYRNYTKTQVLELLPWVLSYKSNLVAQSQSNNDDSSRQNREAISMVKLLENDLNRILQPPPPPAQVQPPLQVASRPLVANAPAAAPAKPAVDPKNITVVNRFFPIPLGTLPNNGEGITTQISAHHWVEGKLVLDFEHLENVVSRNEKERSTTYSYADFADIAIFDPATEHWEVITGPEVSHATQNNFYHRTTLLRGNLFTCERKQIRKFDFKNRQWQVLGVSDGNDYELFAVNGRLYGANSTTILEIAEDGKTSRLLASTRRRPAASVLDTQSLGIPVLFEGADHALRVVTADKVFTQTANGWHEDGSMSLAKASIAPELLNEGVVFRTMPNMLMEQSRRQPYSLSWLAPEAAAPELCLVSELSSAAHRFQPPSGFYQAPKPAPNPSSAKPLWPQPVGLVAAYLPAASHKSDLYLLENHSKVQEIIDQQKHLVLQKKTIPQDGYHAELLCFSRSLSSPQKVFLKFDAPQGLPPLAPIKRGFMESSPYLPASWLLFTTQGLILGLEIPRGVMAYDSEDDPHRGIWLLPIPQLEAAVARQKQLFQAEQQKTTAQAAAEKQLADQRRQDFLLKYDRNHNGILDPEERAEILDDPAFITSELEVIDANHNGWLDVAELAYFDANRNKLLEPREQAGIELAQHLLAGRLLKKSDANGDGFLDRAEFAGLCQTYGFGSGPSMFPGGAPRFSMPAPFPDSNQDGKVDADELESFLIQQTRRDLIRLGGMGAAMSRMQNKNSNETNSNETADPRQKFKSALEAYWQSYSDLPVSAPAKISPKQQAEADQQDAERRRNLMQLMQKN